MTRINIGIPVENLTDEHLRAEHREIKRVCSRFKKRLDKNNFENIPTQFTLNKGHELFCTFIPQHTLERYKKLHSECKKRNFSMTNFSNSWEVFEGTKYENVGYTPTLRDSQIIIERIKERIENTKLKSFHYYGKKISQKKAIKLLNS